MSEPRDPTAGGPADDEPPAAGSRDTTWAVLAHVLGIVFSVIPALVVLLARGGSSGFVRDQALEALNFQVTVLLGYIVSAILIILVIGLIMFFFVGVTSLILGIVAATAASRGEAYRYPVALRIIR